MTELLRLAIQKSGRLFEDSFRLLCDCGIELENGRTTLKTQALNFPLEVYLVRDDDIPAYLRDGVADAGIAGSNLLEENGSALEMVESLGFGRCRLSVAVPRDCAYEKSSWLNGKRIATSYPVLLGRYLKAEGIDAEIHQLSGSVEIAPSIGLADAVCDLVSTGSTLASNGLKEVESIFRSEAVLAVTPELSDGRREALEELRFRMQCVKRARRTKYIMLNAPNECIEQIMSLIPGAKSPSIVPLATPGWSSIHSVVDENDFWRVIKSLKSAGAEGILVVPIEKLVL